MTGRLVGLWQARRGARTAFLGLLLALAACNESTPREKPVEGPATTADSRILRKRFSLEINGFNYTDLYIDSFSVNGQGGGNINVSSPTSGGGGSVCCVLFSPGSELPLRVKVEWTRDGDRWCEQEVLITGPVPASPTHLGIHFFPDGHIEAELTEHYPTPKLRLDRVDPGKRKESGNTVADEQMGKCRNGR
ncbi:DUF3304 domain-containing protein [Archangium lipolyticum]|uniref:DUF3304 domain-containing protein n=1 Tax=Archangium lipolyticum TaxID=2970465 RepID=UPI00214A8729|nr:DUF3304 domain-containing protein [Archangium lipolyticum]